MKFSAFLITALVIFSFACKEKAEPNFRPNFPDKNLQEFIIYGSYVFEDENRIKEYEEDYRNMGHLKENESFLEKYPHMADLGDEGFFYEESFYCYNESLNKEPVFNKNLRARLYDRQGRLLTEDYLRIDSSENSSSSFQHIITYVPHHDDGYRVRFVRLEGGKEIMLKEQEFLIQSKLESLSVIDNSPYNLVTIWTYDEKDECHIAPAI